MHATIHAASADPVSKHLEFTYRVIIRNIPHDSKNLKVWIPAPQEEECQAIYDLRVDAPYPFKRVTDPQYGNRALYFNISPKLPDSLMLRMTFRVRRFEAGPVYAAADSDEVSRQVRRFLEPDALVPIDGQIARQAHEVVRGIRGSRARARALYDHILATMKYDKSGTGWGQGDATFACTERRGNCSDIHSLLIGMARAEGIPARFIMGFPIPDSSSSGEIKGYHCWADLYLDGEGWVPVDASEAIKHPEKASYFFGTLDPNRVAFSIGRDIRLGSSSDTSTVNYFIYPQVLLDGQPYSDVTRRFEFRILPADDAPQGAAPTKSSGSS